MVEVEPGVLDRRVVRLAYHLGEVVTDLLLEAFLVNQVDEVVLAVGFPHLVHVALVGVLVAELVGFDLESWSPFEVRALLPDEGDAPSSLEIGEHIIAVVVDEGHDLFSLCIVANVALVVRSPGHEAHPCSALIPPRHQDEADGFLVDGHEPLHHQAAYERLDPVVEVQVLELGSESAVVVEPVVVAAVLEALVGEQGERLGEVILWREVKSLGREEPLEH